MYVWQCKKCGRIATFKFKLHARFKGDDIGCDGTIKRISLNNIW